MPEGLRKHFEKKGKKVMSSIQMLRAEAKSRS